MRRLFALWLTLLGSFWLTRAVVSAVLFQRGDFGPATVFEVAAVPLIQAVALWWVTREAGETPSSER